jgi:spermidine/putrescine transport system permease protein
MGLPKAYLVFLLLAMYLPIVLVVIYSFNVSKLSSVWTGTTLNWYRALFRDRDMFEALRNSLVLATVSSCAAAVIGTLGAFGASRVKLPFSGSMEYLSMLPIMIPEIILGMVFLAFFSLIGLPFGMTTLIIAHTAFNIPYVFLMVKARLAGFDNSLYDAARDLGAGEVRTFLDITLPLIFPAILSGMLLSFAMSFDDVIISVFVTGVNTNTLPIKIYSQIKTGVTPKTNALCSLLFAATVLLGFLSVIASRGGKRQKNKKTEE